MQKKSQLLQCITKIRNVDFFSPPQHMCFFDIKLISLWFVALSGNSGFICRGVCMWVDVFFLSLFFVFIFFFLPPPTSIMLGVCWPKGNVVFDRKFCVGSGGEEKFSLDTLTNLRRTLGVLQSTTSFKSLESTALQYYLMLRRWVLQKKDVGLRARVGIGSFTWCGNPKIRSDLGDVLEPDEQSSDTLLWELAMAGLCAFYVIWNATYEIAPMTNFVRPELQHTYFGPGAHQLASKRFDFCRRLLIGVWRDALGPMYAARSFALYANDTIQDVDYNIFWALICLAAGCRDLVTYNIFEVENSGVLRNERIDTVVEIDDIIEHMIIERQAFNMLAGPAHLFGCAISNVMQTSCSHGGLYALLVYLRRMAAAKAMMRAGIFLSRYAVYLDALSICVESPSAVAIDTRIRKPDIKAKLCFIRYGTKAVQLALLFSSASVDSQDPVRIPAITKFVEEMRGEHDNNIIPNYLSVVRRNQYLWVQNLAHEHSEACACEMSMAVTIQYAPQYFLTIVGLCQNAEDLPVYM